MSIAAITKSVKGFEMVDLEQNPSIQSADIIFILSGPSSKTINLALQKILIAAQHVDSGHLPTCKATQGSYYVYGYFKDSTAQKWSDAFYIGKGINYRLLSHVRARSRNKNLAAPIPPKNDKERKIDEWLGTHTINEAEGSFVKCLYAQLSELEAFFLEKFLIVRARRQQDIANDTAGNHNYEKYTSICQPKAFDENSTVHLALWHKAVNSFIKNPLAPHLHNTIRPSLTFIGLEPELDAFEKSLSATGLCPCDMRNKPENRLSADLMVRKFCSVSGAGDAKLSFEVANQKRKYRFDFRIPPAGLDTILTLRPQSCLASENRDFVHYFSSTSVQPVQIRNISTIPAELKSFYSANFIKNKKNWPFYKPLTWDSNGRNDPTYFPMCKPNDLVDARVNWLQGNCVSISLVDAIQLIIKGFA